VADNGSGCVTYRITTTAGTGFRKIYKVLSLSQRQQTADGSERSRLVVNDSVKRLYDLFARDLFTVERDINANIDSLYVLTCSVLTRSP
jgi:hypothetical protein